jgi:hypothetical protein
MPVWANLRKENSLFVFLTAVNTGIIIIIIIIIIIVPTLCCVCNWPCSC